MDITSTTATTLKTPEAESETSTRIQPKPLSFSNGVLKRTQSLNHHDGSFNNNHHAVVVNYKECLKNHAASLGGHAVDGCGEFMPSPNVNLTDPTSLKCAACGCHRNFHRREPEEPIPRHNTIPALEYQPHHRHQPPPPTGTEHSCPSSPSPPPISSSYYPSAPHVLLALSTGLSAPATENNTPISAVGNSPVSINGRKRFRTKFTQNQKEKMLEFAEKVQWKMQKRDEDLISEFCNEIGVDKGVLKVWMHNNKSTLGKKDNNFDTTTTTSINNGNGITYGVTATTATQYHQHHQHDDGDNKNHHSQDLSHGKFLNGVDSISSHVVVTNGSSSSS